MAAGVFAEVPYMRSHSLIAYMHGVVVVMVRVLPPPVCTCASRKVGVSAFRALTRILRLWCKLAYYPTGRSTHGDRARPEGVGGFYNAANHSHVTFVKLGIGCLFEVFVSLELAGMNHVRIVVRFICNEQPSVFNICCAPYPGNTMHYEATKSTSAPSLAPAGAGRHGSLSTDGSAPRARGTAPGIHTFSSVTVVEAVVAPVPQVGLLEPVLVERGRDLRVEAGMLHLLQVQLFRHERGVRAVQWLRSVGNLASALIIGGVTYWKLAPSRPWLADSTESHSAVGACQSF